MTVIKKIFLPALGLLILTGMGVAQSPMTVDANMTIDKMHDMILQSDYKQLKIYLKNGADVNAADDIGNTALFFAAKIGDKKTVDLLIDHGADVNQINMTGTTPLMIAAKYGNIYTVKKLLNHGADPTVINKSGCTAYVFAKVYKKSDVMRLLDNYKPASSVALH